MVLMNTKEQKFLTRIYRNGCTIIHYNKTNIYHLRRKANPYKTPVINYHIVNSTSTISNLINNGYCYVSDGMIYLTKKGVEYAKIFLTLEIL
jgi:cysteinyl-tRNA synthetase